MKIPDLQSSISEILDDIAARCAEQFPEYYPLNVSLVYDIGYAYPMLTGIEKGKPFITNMKWEITLVHKYSLSRIVVYLGVDDIMRRASKRF